MPYKSFSLNCSCCEACISLTLQYPKQMPNLMQLICKETHILLTFTETFYSLHIKCLVPTTITNKTYDAAFQLVVSSLSKFSKSFFRQVVVMPQLLKRLRKLGRKPWRLQGGLSHIRRIHASQDGGRPRALQPGHGSSGQLSDPRCPPSPNPRVPSLD